MTVYVDDMRRWSTVAGRGARWSHLIADSQDELVAFAVRIGLRAEWMQKRGTRWEHFDVTDGMRARAIALGAVQIEFRDLPHVRRRSL